MVCCTTVYLIFEGLTNQSITITDINFYFIEILNTLLKAVDRKAMSASSITTLGNDLFLFNNSNFISSFDKKCGIQFQHVVPKVGQKVTKLLLVIRLATPLLYISYNYACCNLFIF